MSTMEIPEAATSPVPASIAADETPAAQPAAHPEDRAQLEERRRDAYRIG